MNYYNEFDHKAAAWLRELIKAKLIPDGYVDERSIADVKPADLAGFTQCHFFAGIGGWSLALRLAGWPEDREVWTGSCPCQPFSAAGKRRGKSDERHLWPVFKRLIKERRPQIVFGEQVASAEVIGTQLEAAFVVAVQNGEFAKANKLAKQLVASSGFHYSARWIDGICADLEAENYTSGGIVVGAHSRRAPHIRQRLYWLAYAEPAGFQRRSGGAMSGERRAPVVTAGDGEFIGLAGWLNQEQERPVAETGRPGHWSRYDILQCTDGKARRIEPESFPLAHGVPARVVRLRGYGNAIVPQVAAEFIQASTEAIESLTP
jgi:DNA (cytosine-5)-methyltransferase 1